MRNEGKYDPFPYRYFGYSKFSRNPGEMDTPRGIHSGQTNPIQKRVLRPRYLYVQMDSTDDWNRINMDEQPENKRDEPYVFVAYTSVQFDNGDQDDVEALHVIARAAARNAGVSAYWIGSSCMPEEKSLENDVSAYVYCLEMNMCSLSNRSFVFATWYGVHSHLSLPSDRPNTIEAATTV